METNQPAIKKDYSPKIFILFFAWIFVLVAPWFILYAVIDPKWVPEWAGVVAMLGLSLVVLCVIVLIVIIRHWRKNTKRPGSRGFAVVVLIPVLLIHALAIFRLAIFVPHHELAAATYEFDLPSGKTNFLVRSETDMTYFFDGGYSVWVWNDSSPFMSQIGGTIWKSEFTFKPEVSGDTVRFYFYDNTLFMSNHGSGDACIQYIATKPE